MKITVSYEPMDKERKKAFSDCLSGMIADYLRKKGVQKRKQDIEKKNKRKKMNNP